MSEARVPLIAGNWKMHKTVSESETLVRDIINGDRRKTVEVMVAPPFTSLLAVARLVDTSDVRLGAQNVHWERQGAFTGEISPVMLADLGVDYAIVGHSERRSIFLEGDDMIRRKLMSVLAHDMAAILCIGETLEERRADKVHEVLRTQLQGALAQAAPDAMRRVVVAYEPVWAIGTGVVATPAQAQEAHSLIRSELAQRFDKELASRIRILYGGSVKSSNARELMACEDIDGVLVGGASLTAEEFLGIINY
jgi:triosephosphate isomerase